MKQFTAFVLFLLISFSSIDSFGQKHPKVENLNCADYWSQVDFSKFCGLNTSNFEFNTIPVDICNADQSTTYRFDDLVSIRVYNHFSKGSALEEYGLEKIDAAAQPGYMGLTDIGDDGFAVIQTQFGKLDSAVLQVVVNDFTVSLDVNGAAHNDANNCFDQNSVINFMRALVEPLLED